MGNKQRVESVGSSQNLAVEGEQRTAKTQYKIEEGIERWWKVTEKPPKNRVHHYVISKLEHNLDDIWFSLSGQFGREKKKLVKSSALKSRLRFLP
jgi:expansin (peptidoglycan-binding protein)